jgi:hypothetical protein
MSEEPGSPGPLPDLLHDVNTIAKVIRQSHGFTSTDDLGSFQHSWLASAMVNLARSEMTNYVFAQSRCARELELVPCHTLCTDA